MHSHDAIKEVRSGRENHCLSKRHDHHKLPYSGKVWRGECLANLLFSSVWQKKVWRMNRSAKGLLIVATTLDGFSLTNRRRFNKFTKLSPRYTVSHASDNIADTKEKTLEQHEVVDKQMDEHNDKILKRIIDDVNKQCQQLKQDLQNTVMTKVASGTKCTA